jgi:hypothetical protein
MSTLAAAEPTAAHQIDAARHVDLTRSQLETLYPGLPSRELDLLTFRVAEIASIKPMTGPAGDWFCATDNASVFRLTIRATSYSLAGGYGPPMAGEYTQAGHEVAVTKGPLKGMGIEHGVLAVASNGRVLAFDSDKSVLRCNEVL